jgi:hypothetical protein
MEISLQSRDEFNIIAFLDLVSGTFSIKPKPEKMAETNGFFSIHNGDVVSFFRFGEKMFIRVNEKTTDFQENDKIFIESLLNNHCVFSIQRGQEIIFTWNYKINPIIPPISAFRMVNPMASEEDFDIFIFMRNVINDIERRKRVFLRLSS